MSSQKSVESPSDILDFYAETNAAYLHARGAVATQKLVSLVNGAEGEKVLEIGFGTASTMVHMATAFPQTQFYGVDVSPLMYQKAKARLRFCGLEKRCTLFAVERGQRLPFDDGFFDKIYVESVLGMQPGEELNFAVGEIGRLLKPGGTLILNETIWLDSTTAAEMQEFNRACMKKFGVLQANDRYPYVADWIELLRKHHLQVEACTSLDDADEKEGIKPRGITHLLSRIFTFWGRLKTKISPRHRAVQKRYDREESVFYGGKKYLTGMLIKSVRG